MNSELEKLKSLQRVENELRRVEAELADAPRLSGELDARLAEERGRLDAVRDALDACQKSRRRHETELQDFETRRSKYKGQLMEVKTNKEYTAMLHEIEAVEREIRGREDVILEEMERADQLAGEVKTEEGAFRSAEETHRAEAKQLAVRKQALEAEQERLTAERDQVAATLRPEHLELFQRVARLRGSGVAEARDGTCQLCHVVLRPQMYVDLKRDDSIIQCPSCSRVLYYEAPAPEVTPPQP